ncbi:minor tail protein [Gordonia phage VanLee]|uniref:Minor tail protein n=1 Tax=Gordonia phage VanLee TaxID=2845816 RepID=A0A8F2D9M8_9CAUD|nr:minor tail protein [Gordonia phage VanLee]QWS68143.1 minor tail protein [Gordonia phage VanLee]
MSTPNWLEDDIVVEVPDTFVPVVDVPDPVDVEILVVQGRDGTGLRINGHVPAYADLPTGLGPADRSTYLVRADGRLYPWNGASFPPEGQGLLAIGPTGDDGRGIEAITISGDTLEFEMSDDDVELVVVPALTSATEASVAAEAARVAAVLAREAAADFASAAGGHVLTAQGHASAAEGSALAAAQSADEAADVVASGVPNATPTAKGGIRLAGDLGGTWDAPTVPDLEEKVDDTDPRLSDARPLMTVDLTTATAAATAAKTATGVAPAAGQIVKLTFTSGNTVGAPTLSVNGGPAGNIRTGNNNVGTAGVQVSAGGFLLLYFDGTFFHMISEPTLIGEISEADITAGTSTTQRGITGRRAKFIIDTARNGVELAANKGQANGYAGLDAGGKVPIGQLPSSIMEYRGVWNAATNSPALANGTGDTGDVYRVGTAGTRDLGAGAIEFAVGDYAVYNAAGQWEKSDTTDAVASVAGLIGVITAAALRTALSITNVNNTSDADKPISTAQSNGLVARTNVPNSAYLTGGDGSPLIVNWSQGVDGNTVAARDSAGRLSGATPATANHLANKTYVDGRIVFGPLPATGEAGVLYVVP